MMKIKLLIGLLLISSFTIAQAHKVEVKDDAGAGKYVVGAVDYSDYSKEVLSIPHVGALTLHWPL